MARTATGIDAGTRTVELIQGEVKGTSFLVTDFFVAPNPDGTIAGAWGALDPRLKPAVARVGITGREVNVRYTRVPRLPDWQLKKLMRFEAEEVGGQSETRVASDFNVLPEIPEIEGEDVVLLAMARESLLEEHARGLAAIGGKLDAFTPNAIGLYNAFLHYGVVMEDTVLVANIGHENLDVILMRGTDLLFARNLSGGSKLFDEALAERFQIEVARARRYKEDEARLDTGEAFTDSNQEKAARALTAPAGQLLSLLQSAVLFAKNQVKLSTLKLDRVFLCGGGAALPGLPRYLQDAMGVPVELFDPFVVVDTTKLAPDEKAALEDHRLESVVALGLATSASDPEAYAIEILPASLRKRREFMGGPAFLIAAAVLAVVYLGLFAWRQGARLDVLSAQARTLDSQWRRKESNHRRTVALLEENAELAELATRLQAQKGAGEQLVRVLSVLETTLPDDFWLESLTSEEGFDDELGIARGEERPILRVSGRMREGTDSPTLLWEEFIAGVRTALPEARLKESMGRDDFALAMTFFHPREPDPGTEEDVEEES